MVPAFPKGDRRLKISASVFSPLISPRLRNLSFPDSPSVTNRSHHIQYRQNSYATRWDLRHSGESRNRAPESAFGQRGGSPLQARPLRPGGFLRFSRVAFSRSATQAFLYVEHSCGGLCGTGHHVFLSNEDGKWVVKKTYMLWIS